MMIRVIVSNTAADGTGADADDDAAADPDIINTVIVIRTLYALYFLRKLELAEN
jgi:hypothetical protein